MTQKTKKAGDGAELNFEKSLERLESIVEEMEKGSLGLEQMMEQFEEGRRLLAFCTKKLNEVERRIEILVKKGDSVEAEPFEEPVEEEAGPSSSGKKGAAELF